MAYSVVITKNARKDIQDAINWENNRQVGLAGRLLTEIDEKLITISKSPYNFAVRYDNNKVRRYQSFFISYTLC